MKNKNTSERRSSKKKSSSPEVVLANSASPAGIAMVNGLQEMATVIFNQTGIPQLNEPTTIQLNLRRWPLTFDRPTLSYLYMEYGIIRTAIDQPIDDALRGGVDFESTELDADDLQRLAHYMDISGTWETLKSGFRWVRLFGGGGLLVNNGQDYKKKLDIEAMTDKYPLAFYDVDRWELSMPGDDKRPENKGYDTGDYYYYYGIPVHRSRVLSAKGDAAPSLIRRMLMGWGLSEVEKMVRDLQQYIKANDVIFELLDEAKVDVFGLDQYRDGLMTPGGQAKVQASIQTTNQMKNYLNAVVLDKNDTYEQKQLTFSGLSEMLKEIRIGIASCLRMPVTKLFGISAAGFNSGEDDIENYNAMIESSIRAKMRPMIETVVKLACVKLFGYVPNITFKFKSLRIMDQNQEMDMKTKKQQIILNNYDRGVITAEEMMKEQRAAELLIIDKTDAEEGLLEDFPEPPIKQVTASIKAQDDSVADSDNNKPTDYLKKDKLEEAKENSFMVME